MRDQIPGILMIAASLLGLSGFMVVLSNVLNEPKKLIPAGIFAVLGVVLLVVALWTMMRKAK